MSDLERTGVELFVDGMDNFRQGMGEASGLLTGLGSAALDVGGGALDALGGAMGAVANVAAGVFVSGVALAASGIAAFTAGVVAGAFEAEDAQVVINRLSRQLTAMGDGTDITIQQVQDLAQQFAGLAGGSDDVVVGIQQIAIQSQAVSSGALPDFIQASLDLGAVMGDTTAAATIMALAYDQPSSALAKLKRAHILFTPEQEKQIKAFEAAGNKAGALAIVQGVLADVTSGAALESTQTLSGAWGVFTTTIGEAFETIGAVFLPIMQELGAVVLSTIPYINAIATEFATFITGASDGSDLFTAIYDALILAFGPETGAMIAGIFGTIFDSLINFQAFVTANLPLIQETFAAAWLSIQVATQALADVWTTSLQPALDKMFLAIFGQGPTAQEIMTGLLNAIVVGAQMVADWVVNVLVPAVETFSNWIVNDFTPNAILVRDWLQVNIPLAAQALSDFWTNTLLPAIAQLTNFWNTTLLPTFVLLQTWLATNIPLAITAVTDFWNNTLMPAVTAATDYWNNNLLPAITAVHDFFVTSVIPVLIALGAVFMQVTRIASEIFVATMNTVVLPALTDFYIYILNNVTPVLIDLNTVIATVLVPTFNNFKRDGIDAMAAGMLTLIDAVERLVNWFWGLVEVLRRIHIPEDLTPGSPTPFEIGLRGISAALTDVTSKMSALDALNKSMQPLALTGAGGTSAAADMGRVAMLPVGGGSTSTVNNNINVQANYPRTVGTVDVFTNIRQGLNAARA